jgi:hypothetical protein
MVVWWYCILPREPNLSKNLISRGAQSNGLNKVVSYFSLMMEGEPASEMSYTMVQNEAVENVQFNNTSSQ